MTPTTALLTGTGTWSLAETLEQVMPMSSLALMGVAAFVILSIAHIVRVERRSFDAALRRPFVSLATKVFPGQRPSEPDVRLDLFEVRARSAEYTYWAVQRGTIERPKPFVGWAAQDRVFSYEEFEDREVAERAFQREVTRLSSLV